ncbi:MAG TPA: exodeoxyribonuclease III [Candidatus Portnoybacteria bacterium]|nr:exodeoxyribonuclease III [Candidatus Portnoybacteria bacterium]
MKILSWNVNGLRAIYRKGFLSWLGKSQADIVCLQEIKAQKEQLPEEIIKPKGYYTYFNSAQRKGYSGTAIFSKEKPRKIKTILGLEKFDNEGRIIKATYKNFILINLYLPHGGRQKENLEYKLEVYRELLSFLKNNRNEKIIITGDFNIAHQEIDLARPKQNKNNIMFTSEEKKQISEIIDLGFIDTFRKFHQEEENYTWWPYAFSARERNLGWRIDYIFISRKLLNNLKDAFILKDIKGSDHCPVGIEIKF